MTEKKNNQISIQKIPLFFWEPHVSVGKNFGDELFPMIAERISGKRYVRVFESYASSKLLAGGSILQYARSGDVVWGVGLRSLEHPHSFDSLDVCAVRGPITRDYLQNVKKIMCPEIYGDPALLLPILFPEFKALPVKGRVGIVPHYRDIPYLQPLPEPFKIILPTLPKEQVIQEILSCEFVISSSLHGIVVAEAFGIPARWLRVTPFEPELKFRDYFLGTGRISQYATSIDQAVKMKGEKPIIGFDHAKLLNSFPRHL